jgi:hypothetical protein
MSTYVYITYCYLLSSFVLLFVMAFDFFLYLGGYHKYHQKPQHPPGVIHRLSTGYTYQVAELSTGYPQADTSYPQGASVSVP